MTISLYDATVATFQRNLEAASKFLEKGRAHCEANGIDLGEVVEMRLYPDMAPFRFQVVSFVHHSLGALNAVRAGLFQPPQTAQEGYEDLQQMVAEACAGLGELTPDAVDTSVGKTLIFEMRNVRLQFTVENFLLAFSLPNFFFHATTAYDMLRMRGVPLGKVDFLGTLPMKPA